MAYDGIVVAATVKELNDNLLDGSITKIAQPEKDELLLTVKCNRKNIRLSMSANAAMPMVYIKEDNTLSPITAPNFCMTLRKHIGGGRIKRIYQPGTRLSEDGLERIIVFDIEHLDEMGDRAIKKLVCELMGKYSNIILLKDDETIIDSIKHVSLSVSSVREVLPGREYFIPGSENKVNPFRILEEGFDSFDGILCGNGESIFKQLYGRITGLSPVMSEELCYRASISSDRTYDSLSDAEKKELFRTFSELITDIQNKNFTPNIVYLKDIPEEFAAVKLYSLCGSDYQEHCFLSMSEVLSIYYRERADKGRIRAKSEDIRHILKVLTERTAKKLELQEKQYQDADKKDKFRVYGELINTYGYGLSGGEKELVCQNYYDEGREIHIPLDKDLDARANSKRYFDKYQKLKRTQEALAPQIEEGRQKLYHLDSISNALQIAETEADLNQLRQEMAEYGFIKRQSGKKKLRKEELKSEPMHFVSSDGIDIYVGRNNFQNEELTFKVADGNDWWFHAKNMAGSHVIAKTGNIELPDATCLEAAALAAYYSKACGDDKKNISEKVEVDYIQKKFLKRVPKAAPGYVIYHTNYSIMIEPRSKI
ncbi:MAG: NFACT RNA binding domain-containing protein [Eubacteriales bacterium]|nr:NFACT RNA binding domain-containing protein [Eubacteriales bacterium]